jgi:hypothetical protein
VLPEEVVSPAVLVVVPFAAEAGERALVAVEVHSAPSGAL